MAFNKYEYGNCSCCGEPGLITHKSKGLRRQCQQRINRKRWAENARKKKDEKRAKHGNGGKSLKNLYSSIQEKRGMKCEVSGVELYFRRGSKDEWLWLSCFAHVMPKSKYPKWEFDEGNLVVMHPDLHALFDSDRKRFFKECEARGYKVDFIKEIITSKLKEII